MALTDSEQTDAVMFLGYSARSIIAGSTDYSKILHDRLLDLPDHVESRIKKYLKKIRETDDKIESAAGRAKVEAIDGFKLNPREINILRGVRRNYIKDLSRLLGVASHAQSNSITVSL